MKRAIPIASIVLLCTLTGAVGAQGIGRSLDIQPGARETFVRSWAGGASREPGSGGWDHVRDRSEGGTTCPGPQFSC